MFIHPTIHAFSSFHMKILDPSLLAISIDVESSQSMSSIGPLNLCTQRIFHLFKTISQSRTYLQSNCTNLFFTEPGPTPNNNNNKPFTIEDCFFASLHLNDQTHFSLNSQASLPPFISHSFLRDLIIGRKNKL